jgi:hypothetical protein
MLEQIHNFHTKAKNNLSIVFYIEYRIETNRTFDNRENCDFETKRTGLDLNSPRSKTQRSRKGGKQNLAKRNEILKPELLKSKTK